MAQNALTVTPPNPTPPTNYSFVGATPPTDPAQVAVDDGSPQSAIVFAPKLAVAGTAGYTSVDAEGRGTEVAVTQTYSSAIYNPAGPLVTVSDLGSYTNLVSNPPNQQHASSLSPLTNPALASISPTSTASGSGTFALTATGTNFTKQSVVYVNGVAQNTTFVSATSLTCNPTKKSSAGTWPVTVITGGAVTTAPQTLTFT